LGADGEENLIVPCSGCVILKSERGRAEAGAEILLRIARQYGMTVEWLLIGEEGN
jgi:hypothetical protein